MTIGNQRHTSALKRNEAYSGFFIKNGWVVVFLCVCGIVYGNAFHKKAQVIEALDSQLNVLKSERGLLHQKFQDLELQINSQSDPAWIELVLKKGLGLVPEGQKKVFFYDGPR